ncbi:MAG TPA: hypothetical protein VGL12_06070 [Roseiarcus sp.]|jgi:hypothetical protein
MYDDCLALVPPTGDAAVFKGRRRVFSGFLGDAGEDVALLDEPLERFSEDCRGGRIQDAKTLVAGLWILSHRGRLGV